MTLPLILRLALTRLLTLPLMLLLRMLLILMPRWMLATALMLLRLLELLVMLMLNHRQLLYFLCHHLQPCIRHPLPFQLLHLLVTFE